MTNTEKKYNLGTARLILMCFLSMVFLFLNFFFLHDMLRAYKDTGQDEFQTVLANKFPHIQEIDDKKKQLEMINNWANHVRSSNQHYFDGFKGECQCIGLSSAFCIGMNLLLIGSLWWRHRTSKMQCQSFPN